MASGVSAGAAAWTLASGGAGCTGMGAGAASLHTYNLDNKI